MKLTNVDKRALDRLIELCQFKNAGFHLPHHSWDMGDEDTKQIKEATKLYFDTWVIPLLQALRNEVPASTLAQLV